MVTCLSQYYLLAAPASEENRKLLLLQIIQQTPDDAMSHNYNCMKFIIGKHGTYFVKGSDEPGLRAVRLLEQGLGWLGRRQLSLRKALASATSGTRWQASTTMKAVSIPYWSTALAEPCGYTTWSATRVVHRTTVAPSTTSNE